MIGNHADADIRIGIFLVFHTCHLADLITKCLDCIYIKDRIHVLHNYCQTFQTHTGINILLLKLCIIIVTIIIKLREYVVPNFHIAVTVTADRTARLAAAILFSTVIINLRTWTTRSGSMLPEIIFFTKTEDTVLVYPDFLIPDIECLIILEINGWIQTVFVETDNLCQEFPCPVNRIMLEIITE